MNFESADQAVRFAHNISERREYARSDPLRVRATGGEGLTAADLHAQAAMIHSQVARLGPAEQNSVLAYYGKGKERSQAIRELAEYIWPNVRDVLPDRQTLQLVICHWVTRRPSIRAIVDDSGVSYRKVCAWRAAVLRAWTPLQHRAMTRLHDSLFREGEPT